MNLLFIDSTLKSLNTFIEGCNETTKTIVYNSNDTFDSIKVKVEDLGITSLNHIGLVFENSNEDTSSKLFVENNTFITIDETGIKENLTTQFIKELVATYNVETIDFLACDLLLDSKWMEYFQFLQNQSSDKNLIVRASNNKSGNLQHGGDWILETTNEDITNLYFNETIGQWSHLLDTYVGNADLSVILSNEASNNMYVSGISTTLNLTPNNYEIFTDIPLPASSIVKIIPVFGGQYTTGSSYYIITNESSNNLYAKGKYCLGLTYDDFFNYIVSYKKITTNILNKKVVDVKTNFGGAEGLYVITDENINNLYTAGTYDVLGNGPTNVSDWGTRYVLQQVVLNKKIIDASIGNNYGIIVTNESINNLYYTGNNSKGGMGGGGISRTFLNIYYLNKTFTKVYCCGESSSFVLTTDDTNNLYLSGQNNNIGINTSSFVGKTMNKKIINFDVLNINANDYSPSALLVLTDELSNNLYSLGSASYPRPSTASAVNFVNITENILNKKVTNLLCNGSSISILTDETSNNLYACGKSNYGMSNMGIYDEDTYSKFTNVSLNQTNLYNKKINNLYGFGLGSYSYTLTSDTNNLYIVSIFNNNSNSNKFSFNRMYYKLNKKIINYIILQYYWIGITNESSNNLYIHRSVSSSSGFNILGLYLTNNKQFQNINTIPQHNQILNKQIIGITSSKNYTFAISDESANNLYGVSTFGYPIGNTNNNLETNSYSFIKIVENINDKIITSVSCSDNHVGLLTSESSNNLYMLGINSDGQLNINSSSTTTKLIRFTKSSNNILNKKILKVDCNSNNRTFIITNETSNNLYACGTGVLGNNSTNTTAITTFLKISTNISNKQIINVSTSSDGSVGILTSELSNNFYIAGNSGISVSSNFFTKVSNSNINNKRFIDINLGYNFIKLVSDEENNNIYLISNKNSKLGNGNTSLSNYVFMKPTLPITIKANVYVPPVVATSVPVVINTAPLTITDSSGNTVVSAPVKYAPKAVTIGNDNKIYFPDPTKTSIAIAPVQTTEAVQKYESVLNVSAKNQVSGYIKLEPAGTTFEKHISLEFDVDPFIQPVVYFKSSTDPAPVLIPSSNNSNNSVYYTANTSTGRVILYTRHFSEAIVTQDQATFNPPIGFVLSKFNTLLEMGVSGELFKEQIPVMDASGIAEYYVKASDMRNVFVFQTDSRDIDNVANQDVKYFVRKNQWPQGLVLNPCHAWVQTSKQIASSDKLGLIPDNRQLVKHDFIRHISKSLFNTHLGVDLFQNESELKYDLAYKGHNSAWGSIWNSMTSISDLSLNTTIYQGLYGTDPSYGYYLTNDLSNNSNICRQLLGQVITSAPTRLQNLNTYAIDLSNGYYSVPLIDGDSISFKLTLQPAPNQHLLLNSATPIPTRSYQIRVNLRDTVTRGTTHQNGTNLIVNDPLPDTYLGSVPTDNLNSSYPANYV